jgi:small lipoprotein (TIGR04452 family)
MKWNFILYILIFNLTHCPLIDPFHIKMGRVSGEEAKLILRERLSSFFIKDISDNNTDAILGDFLMPNLARIEDDGIYSRREVENCATRIFLAGLAIDEPNIRANRSKRVGEALNPSDPNSRFLPPLLCNLRNFKGQWIDLN